MDVGILAIAHVVDDGDLAPEVVLVAEVAAVEEHANRAGGCRGRRRRGVLGEGSLGAEEQDAEHERREYLYCFRPRPLGERRLLPELLRGVQCGKPCNGENGG